jgi:large subunit ribosomal protein L24
MSRVKKDDVVMVISGKDRGKKGKVLKTYPSEKKVIVEGVNFTKKHQRPTNQYREGGIIERESPIYVSKVLVVCPNCDKPTRIAHKMLEDGSKVRACKKCGEIIDKV